MKTRATCSTVVCTFAQPDDEHSSEVQELKITLTHEGAGAFLVLETERWAVDHPDEVRSVMNRVWKCRKLIDDDL